MVKACGGLESFLPPIIFVMLLKKMDDLSLASIQNAFKVQFLRTSVSHPGYSTSFELYASVCGKQRHEWPIIHCSWIHRRCCKDKQVWHGLYTFLFLSPQCDGVELALPCKSIHDRVVADCGGVFPFAEELSSSCDCPACYNGRYIFARAAENGKGSLPFQLRQQQSVSSFKSSIKTCHRFSVQFILTVMLAEYRRFTKCSLLLLLLL